MIKILIFFCCALFSTTTMNSVISDKNLVEVDKKEALKILLAVIAPVEQMEKINNCCDYISDLINSTGQFSCNVKNFDQPKNKEEITSFFKLGYPAVIFINNCDNDAALQWRLYDATEGIMVKGKKYIKQNDNNKDAAIAVANQIIEALTGKLASFGTKISYIKRVKKNLGKQQYIICCSNLDGTDEKIILKNPGMYVGLYWHKNALFCSEFTKYNIRLIKINQLGQKQIIFDLKGNCVGISLSDDLNNAVYCKSGNIWLYHYDPILKKSANKEIIKNDGKNISPILLANGNIIFCSDSKNLKKNCLNATGPQIYLYKQVEDQIENITSDGYCVGPAYNKFTNKIVYSKKINGTMQLFLIDLITKVNTQLTFDSGNKIDSCFSPCGNYIVFCFQKNNLSSIGIYNIILKSWKLITNSDQFCICPTWSGY